MGVVLHWSLPTNGDSRTDLSLGNAVGAVGSRVVAGGAERAPDIAYIGQIARSAQQLGFAGALTPTSSWCEDAWVMTAGLTQVTERFKFLEDRYRRAGEFLHVVRELWRGEAVDFVGEHYEVRGARIVPAAVWPQIYLGGSSAPAIEVAGQYADVYLTWGEPPGDVADKLDRVSERAKAAGRGSRIRR